MTLSRRALLLSAAAGVVVQPAFGAEAPYSEASAGFDQPRLAAPKGRTETITYQSRAVGAERKMVVYLPPGYDTSTVRYPTLYLRHGGGPADQAVLNHWPVAGAAPVILDNLLADRKAVPMIVAMPASEMPAALGSPFHKESIALAAREFAEDIVPALETRFRARAGAENRAMAGLSVGGGQSFHLGLANQDKLGAIGSFSTGVFGGIEAAAILAQNSGRAGAPVAPPPFNPTVDLAPATSDPAGFNRRIKLLYISVGDEDPRAGPTAAAVDLLRKAGVNVVATRQHGGHTWDVWRQALADFAPRLFR